MFQIGLVVFSAGRCCVRWLRRCELLIAAACSRRSVARCSTRWRMSIIRNVFDDPRERAQAIGVWGAMIGLSMALGPIIGGALVDSVGWRWVFLVNVPVGLAALVLTATVRARVASPHGAPAGPGRAGPGDRRAGLAHLRDHRGRPARASDLARRSSACSACRCVSFGAWCSTSCAAASRCSRCGSSAAPRSRAPARSRCSRSPAIGGFLFLNTLYLQDVRGLSPLHAGLYMLPMAGATLVFAPMSGRIVGAQRDARLPLLIALGRADRRAR